MLTEVLPDLDDFGRDLGVVNVASALPQVVAPVIAALVVSSLGGYAALYLLAAVATLTGAVLVDRIPGVA